MILHLTVAWLLAAASPQPAAPAWEWRGAADLLDVDLVRAEVRIVAAPNATAVQIVPEGVDADAAAFSAVPNARGIVIRDRYPPRGPWVKECLPAVDERGDYWTYAVLLRVTIAAPPGTRIRVRVMSGSIHAAGVGGQFDLKTRDGIVERGG